MEHWHGFQVFERNVLRPMIPQVNQHLPNLSSLLRFASSPSYLYLHLICRSHTWVSLYHHLETEEPVSITHVVIQTKLTHCFFTSQLFIKYPRIQRCQPHPIQTTRPMAMPRTHVGWEGNAHVNGQENAHINGEGNAQVNGKSNGDG